MAAPNFKNRTLWTGDNLHVMRGLNAETVDLIYLDPPFNSNRDYAAPGIIYNLPVDRELDTVATHRRVLQTTGRREFALG